MPPVLFFILQLPFTQLGYALFPAAIANGIIAGSFTFCESMNSSRRNGSELTEWFIVIYLRYPLRLHALCVSKYPLLNFSANFDMGSQPSSYQASGLYAWNEEVSSSSPLQEFWTWFWRHKYVYSSFMLDPYNSLNQQARFGTTSSTPSYRSELISSWEECFMFEF